MRKNHSVNEVIVIGAGVVGLGTAMLLAADGRRVVVLERDPAPPPEDPETAWTGWGRQGVNQFQLLHSFLPRFRELLDAELPGVTDQLVALGELRTNRLFDLPEAITGGRRPGDERFEVGHRPTAGDGGRVGSGGRAHTGRRGAPRGGRRRALLGPAVGRGAPRRWGRHHRWRGAPGRSGGRRRGPALVVPGLAGRRRRPDDPGGAGRRGLRLLLPALPLRGWERAAALGPPLQAYDSISIAALPADHGTWGVGFVTSGRDATLRAARDPETWDRVLRGYPLMRPGWRVSRSRAST